MGWTGSLVTWEDHVRWSYGKLIVRIDSTRMTKGQLRKSDKIKSKITPWLLNHLVTNLDLTSISELGIIKRNCPPIED